MSALGEAEESTADKLHSFLTEDPGRQMMSGSFQPLDTDDWSEQALLKPHDALFSAVLGNRIADVEQQVSAVPEGEQRTKFLAQRDAPGRTALHLALLLRQVEMATVLVKLGARMTSRLVDGRTGVHLAAAMGDVGLLATMFERSDRNAEEAAAKAPDEEEDEDEEDEDAVIVRKPREVTDISQDNELEPDVIDVAVIAWDSKLPAIAYAVLSGSSAAVEHLVKRGAKVKKTQIDGIPLLALPLLSQDDQAAAGMVRTLQVHGARCTDRVGQPSGWHCNAPTFFTVLHFYIGSQRLPLLVALLEGIKKEEDLNQLAISEYNSWGAAAGAITSGALAQALAMNDLAAAALLLSKGARCTTTPADHEQLLRQEGVQKMSWHGDENRGLPFKTFVQPWEASLVGLNLGYTLLGDEPLASRDALSFAWPRLALIDQLEQAEKEAHQLAEAKVENAASEKQKDYTTPIEYLRYWLESEQDHHTKVYGIHHGDWTDTEWARNPTTEQQVQHAPRLAAFFSAAIADIRSRFSTSSGGDPAQRLEAAVAKSGGQISQLGAPVSQHDQFRPEPKKSDANSSAQLAARAAGLQPQLRGINFAEKDPPRSHYDRYLALVQAVWDGDVDAIKRMTLPGHGGNELLSVSFTIGEPDTNLLNQIVPRTAHLLELAIVRKQWEALRVLCEIVEKQYVPPKDTNAVSFSVGRDEYDESDDGGSCPQAVELYGLLTNAPLFRWIRRRYACPPPRARCQRRGHRRRGKPVRQVVSQASATVKPRLTTHSFQFGYAVRARLAQFERRLLERSRVSLGEISPGRARRHPIRSSR